MPASPPTSHHGNHGNTRSLDDLQNYYRSIQSIDIGEVARELLAPHKITLSTDHAIKSNCPVHGGDSGTALSVDIPKQSWHCHGCGVGGGVLRLVEWCRSRTLTPPGTRGAMPAFHRDARDWLAARHNPPLPPLQLVAMDEATLAEYERAHVEARRVRQALFALSTLYHEALDNAPEVKSWLAQRYPIAEHTHDRLLTGYVHPGEHGWTDGNGKARQAAQYELMGTAGDGTISEALRGLGAPFTKEELLSTGAFTGAETTESLASRFVGRIIFPYWGNGSIVYGIARSTPFTPARKAGGEIPKYEKLATRSEKYPYVSACVKNNYLWNEDCLLRRPKSVTMPEGMTDAMAIYELGLPVVSPVTTKVAAHDWPRFIGLLVKHGVETVYLANDLEFNGEGQRGALRSAAHLEAAGIAVRLIQLPVSDAQAEAIETLKGLNLKPGDRHLSKAIAGLVNPEDRARANAALPKAKQDVASYLLSIPADDRRAAWEALQREAKSPLELAIGDLPPTLTAARDSGALDDVVAAVCRLPVVDVEIAVKKIQVKLGGGGKDGVSLSTLKNMIAEAKRRGADSFTREAADDPADCIALVNRIILLQGKDKEEGNKQAAIAAFDWFQRHGAHFFFSPGGAPFMFWERKIYWLDAAETTTRRALSSMIQEKTGVVIDTPSGRTFRHVLANLALQRGKKQDTLSWSAAKVGQRKVWITLANENNEILRIDSAGVALLENGNNVDKIILRASEQMEPVEFTPGVTGAELDALLHTHLASRMACIHEGDREMITLWASVYGLLDFAGTRPILRLEGGHGSGKTTAVKLLTALIKGAAEQAAPTTAADYSMASTDPVVALDNVEEKDLKDDLLNFQLMGASGVVRIKRAAGTDSAVIREPTRCLIITDGIEPAGASKPELMSRQFAFPFSNEAQERARVCEDGKTRVFAEADVVAELLEARSRILSGMYERWSRILKMLEEGARDDVLVLFEQVLKDHGKKRSNDYLALMYLALIVDLDPEERARWLVDLHPGFHAALDRLNKTTASIAQATSPIVNALAGLFAAWQSVSRGGAREPEDAFRLEYPIEFEGYSRTAPTTARLLHQGLVNFCKKRGIKFPYESAEHLGRRLQNDLANIEAAGFKIEIGGKGKAGEAKGRNLYVVTQLGGPSDPPAARQAATAPAQGAPVPAQPSMWPSREPDPMDEPDPVSRPFG